MTADPEAVRHRLLAAMAAGMGADPRLVDVEGTTPIADDRRGRGTAACYQIGRHTFIPHGPGVGDDALVGPEIERLRNSQRSTDDAEFRRFVDRLGGAILGAGRWKTRATIASPLAPAPGDLHVFDWEQARDLELIGEFVASCDADELVEADLDLDRLDPLALGLLGADGRLMAYSSSILCAEDPQFGDIAVITHPEARRGGWGRAAVGALIDTLLVPNGLEPLYRCDVDNTGSDRLSKALGFTVALTLTAADFPSVSSSLDSQ